MIEKDVKVSIISEADQENIKKKQKYLYFQSLKYEQLGHNSYRKLQRGY
jgi:hypothetical protein